MEYENVGGHEVETNARFRVKLQRVKILGASRACAVMRMRKTRGCRATNSRAFASAFC